MPGRHRKPPHRRAPGRHRKARGPARWVMPALAVVVALGLGGVAAAAAISGGSASSPDVRADLPAPSSAPATSAVPTTPPPSPSSSTARPPRAPAPFVLTVTGRVSWVEVGVPGRQPLFEGLLRHGRTLRSRAHPLSVVIGDAGAVRLVVHGRVRAPAGRPGEVLRFVVP